MVKKIKMKPIDVNKKLAWEQIENWVKNYFNKDIQVIVKESTTLWKEGRYAKTEFGQTPVVYIDRKLLTGTNKKEVLFASCREAVRIGLWANKYPHSDLSKEYRTMLKKYQLPDYGGVAETGTKMYTYRCLKCKTVYYAKKKKLPPTQDISFNPKKLTGCCEAMFEDAGWVFYTNKELQELSKHLKVDLSETFDVENEGDS